MNAFSAACLRVVLPVALASLLAVSAGAEVGSPRTGGSACQRTLRLDEFRAYALQNSPLVAEIDKEYALELAEAFETETLPNPELQMEHTFTQMHLSGAHDPQAQDSIGQPLRLSNFGARAKVATLLRRSGDSQKRARLLEFTQRLIIQFKTLETKQRIEAILKSAEARASKKVSLILDGVKKGLFSGGEEKLFEGEKFRLQAQERSVSATIAMLQRDLSQLLGLPCMVSTTPIDERRMIPSLESLLQRASESDLSERSRIDLLGDLTREQVRLAELDTVPQITPRLVYQHTNDHGDFFGAGITIPLPLWNRNQAEKVRASAEERVAQVKTRFQRAGGFEAQVEYLRIAAFNAQEQADIFSKKVVPSFEAALRSQERLYLEGKGNILQIWQTLRAVNEVQIEELMLWLQATTARAELSVVVGDEV